MTSRIGRRLRWHPLSIEIRLLAHALRHGLWRSLSPVCRKVVPEQQVLTWRTGIPDRGSSPDIVSYLRQSGLRVQEGGNAFYLPPQPGLVTILGAAVEHYPPDSGFKVLRDFRGLEEAHYLHPARQTPLRRRLIGTPRDQLIAANYLHHLELGPRVWDICLLRAGRIPMPTFVVHHVDGTAPDAAECSAFLRRLRDALADTELRISVPNWERNKDFRCPTCNHNLLRDGAGALSYIDFQNFAVRNPQRLLESALDGGTVPRAIGRPRVFGRKAGAAPSCRRGRRGTAANAAERFLTVRRHLREHGVDLPHRVVLDIGCDTGVMLHHALSAGARWALGWDRPAGATQARAMAVALGFTRLDIIPAELNDHYDVGASIPDWLERQLGESIVFVRATPRHVGIPGSLADLPWRALVYRGHHAESPAEADDRIRAFLRRGVRVAHRFSVCDTDSGQQRWLMLIREPATVATTWAPPIQR